MGDIADMYTDYPDEYDYDGEPYPATHCKRCGQESLSWEMTPAGWRLMEGHEVHDCNDPFKIIADMDAKKHRSDMFFTSGKAQPIDIKPGDRRKVIL